MPLCPGDGTASHQKETLSLSGPRKLVLTTEVQLRFKRHSSRTEYAGRMVIPLRVKASWPDTELVQGILSGFACFLQDALVEMAHHGYMADERRRERFWNGAGSPRRGRKKPRAHTRAYSLEVLRKH